MFSIGALARETGVKIPTIRYYEQLGLIDEPARRGAISGAMRRAMPSACGSSVMPASWACRWRRSAT